MPDDAAYLRVSSTPINRESALVIFRTLAQRAFEQGIVLRAPPPEPTTCCGRGCHGCVWESFLDAASFWQEDALQAL